MITTLLFDLDGTLLPMDTEVFTKHYFSLLVQKLAPYGYEAKPLIGAVLARHRGHGGERRKRYERRGFLELLCVSPRRTDERADPGIRRFLCQ